MPGPRAVELYARLQEEWSRVNGCHGLAPWSLTLVANRGGPRFLAMPRARPVECSRFRLVAGGNVKHHGASPWHLRTDRSACFCSWEHETPQGQPVVSAKASVHHLCFTYFSWRTGLPFISC